MKGPLYSLRSWQTGKQKFKYCSAFCVFEYPYHAQLILNDCVTNWKDLAKPRCENVFFFALKI